MIVERKNRGENIIVQSENIYTDKNPRIIDIRLKQYRVVKFIQLEISLRWKEERKRGARCCVI